MKLRMAVACACACFLLLLAPGPALAESEVGLGAHQGSGIGPGVAYPSLFVWATEEVLLAFGFSFSTEDAQNYGFYTKFGVEPTSRGSVRALLGLGVEVAEVDRDDTAVFFGPFGGVDARVIGNFSVIADLYPLGILADGDTEAVFLDARVGAVWWFD